LPGRLARRALPAVLAFASLLAACGGSGDPVLPVNSCSVADQKRWLGDYMNEWYFWTGISPRPDPAAYADVASYFEALLYRGSDPAFPTDRWSRVESTASFSRYYGEGAALGYGVSVAGLEVAGQPDRPLYVRHVEPRSAAAGHGVQRGDQVLAMNGRTAAEVIAADDFTALTAEQAGQALTLVLRRGGVDRTVVVTATEYPLTPVSGTAVWPTMLGGTLGYVAVKDMISQALDPLDSAFASFKATGVSEVVIDLRYNGGGLVSTGAALASYVAGARGSGHNYARLIYNDRQAARNQSVAFAQPAAALGLARAIVLTGRRTCSASEQVINGLRGAGVEVVAIGETTCGKPVGFLPASACGQTYSVVNFESVNDAGVGRYFDGLPPTCAVAEDFGAAQGGLADPLLAAALQVAAGGACTPAGAVSPLRRNKAGGHRRSDEREGMLAR
jgi:hypothetical protein